MFSTRLIFWLVLIVTVLTSSYYAVHSTAVLRWVIHKSGTDLTGTLNIGNIQGGLIGPIKLQDLRFILDNTKVSVVQIELDWNPVSLLFDTIEVTRFVVRGVDITLPEKSEIFQTHSDILNQIDLTEILPITINSGLINSIRIHEKSDSETRNINEIQFVAKKRNEKLIITDFNLTAPDCFLKVTGELSTVPELAIDALVKWGWFKSGSQRISGEATLNGDVSLLKIDATLEQPDNIQINGIIENVISDFRWSGIVKATKVDFSKHIENNKLKSVFSDLINVEANLQGDFDSVILNQAIFSQVNSDTTVQAQGVLAMSDAAWQFTGYSEWQNIQWPVSDDNVVFSPNGRVTGKIAFNHYNLVLSDAKLLYNDVLLTNINAEIIGDDSAVEIKKINSTLSGAIITGTTSLDWQSGISWHSKIKTSHINPSLINIKPLASWPGDISFNLESRGNIIEDSVKARILINNAKGVLREKEFSAFADLNVSKNFYLLNNIYMALGDTTIKGSGSVGKKWNLNWDISQADLNLIDAGLTGKFNSSGILTGERKKPVIRAKISASKISIYNKHRIKNLNVNMTVDLGGKGYTSINILANNIEYQDYQLDRLIIKADGNQFNHSIKIAGLYDADKLEIDLVGSMKNQKEFNWSGKIIKGKLQSELVSNWMLLPVNGIKVTKNNLNLPQLCWHNKKSSWCINSQWRKEKSLDAKIRFNDVPLSLFKGLVHKQFEIGGILQGDAELHSKNTNIHDANISMKISNGYVDMVLNEESTRLSDFDFVKFEFKQKNNSITGNIDLQFEQHEKLNAGIKLTAPDDDTAIKNWPITGFLKSNTKHPDFIRMIYTEIEEIKGDWNSDIKLRGTLNKPIFSGYSKITSSLLSIPVAGLELKNASLSASSITNNNFKITGGFLSGKGEISINGNLVTDPNKGFPAQLVVTGNNIQVFNAKESTVEISPDLKLNKVAERVDVTGVININKANIKTKAALLQSIKISEDVVFVNKQETAEEKMLRKQSRWNFISDVKFILGEQVYFDGYGVSGRLTGSVDVKAEPGKVTTGLGALHIKEGRYKFFSTVLDLDIGRLIFQNDSVANPAINARATKRSGDITAGVRLTGRIKSPEVSIYSIPTMPENEAVSYLLFGKIVNDNSVGLNSLKSSTNQDNGSDGVSLGDALNPGSYIDYAVGLLNSTSVLRIRFELNKNWELYTESSVNHRGAEIIYSFER